jgi:hypothetical protein
MPLITIGVINSKDNGGSAFLTGAFFGGVAVGVPVDGSLDNTILQDQSDRTYYQILGSSGADIARGFQSERLIDLVPPTAEVEGVTFSFRARLNSAGVTPVCSAFPFTEVWGVLSPPADGYFYGYHELTTEFAEYNFPLTVAPNGVPWIQLGVINFGFMELLRVGLRGRLSCPDDFGGSIPVEWSQASLTVDLKLDPVVTTVSASNVGVGAAELRGVVNAGQGVLGSGLPCTLFPVSWQFMFGDDPLSLEEVGEPGGYILGDEDHPVGYQISGLSPLTTYYFRLKAFCGDEVFHGTVLSFKTPTVDPSFGAF